MKAGKEPMRTFGDLLQFYEMKKDEDEPGGAKKKKGDGPGRCQTGR